MSNHKHKDIVYAAQVQLCNEYGRYLYRINGRKAQQLLTDGLATRLCAGRTVRMIQYSSPEPQNSQVERSGRIGAATRYSYLEHIPVAGGPVVHCWDLKRLGGRCQGYAPPATRMIFLAVIDSCWVSQ